MFTDDDLRSAALDRLKDAGSLLNEGRFDGAIYICGYAVEIALKAKICTTSWWKGFPATSEEFKSTAENLRSVRSHDLEELLRLSGEQTAVKKSHMPEWSAMSRWSPDLRYRPAGDASKSEAELLINSARKILSALGIT